MKRTVQSWEFPIERTSHIGDCSCEEVRTRGGKDSNWAILRDSGEAGWMRKVVLLEEEHMQRSCIFPVRKHPL